MEENNKLKKAECILEYILENDDGVGIALGYGSREMIEKHFKENKKSIFSGDVYYDVYNYMYDEHNVILINSEINDIINIVQKNKINEKFVKE